VDAAGCHLSLANHFFGSFEADQIEIAVSTVAFSLNKLLRSSEQLRSISDAAGSRILNTLFLLILVSYFLYIFRCCIF
jgi:hypothetical protein